MPQNKDIVLLKHDKGRGIVILNRSKHIEKFISSSLYLFWRDLKRYLNISLLDSNRFTNHTTIQLTVLKGKFKRQLKRKVKTKLPPDIYSKVYPTGFSPSRLHGTAKLHKIDTNGKVDDLPIRTILNIGTATYHFAKYLAVYWNL